MKTFKRFTALVLALVMAAMLAVSAYAATVVVKYKVYVYTSQLTFKQYDYSSSTTPSTRNLTILADSSLGSGSALYHVKYVDGALAYCIQPGVRSDDSSNYVQGSSGCWYNLPASVQSGIALVLACGYPSAEYGTAYGDSNSSDIIGAEKWAATQAVIWDLICEYRSPYDYRSWGSSPFYNCVDTSRYPTFALWYSEIVDAMQSATDIPSFAATSSRWCDTIELTKDASGNYSASVTDTNDVLSDFNFSSNSGNGITFTQRGNTLTITATAEAAKGLTSEKTYSATGSAYGIDPDEAVLCWYDSTGKYQSLASYTGTGLDPVRAYIKIKTTVVDEKGSLTISKTDADTKQPLAGVTYRLFDSAGNKVADVTTGTDGVAVFSDLPLGSYTYQEISAPEGYVVDSTKYPITITTTTLNITETRTNALAKGSLTINKTDADTGKALAGVTYRLFDSAGNKIADATTGTNGKAVFSNLPLGSYRYAGTERFPAILAAEQLQEAAQRRSERKPVVQITEAQKALRRLCNGRPSAAVESQVLSLLNNIAAAPEQIKPQPQTVNRGELAEMERRFSAALTTSPVDEDNAKEIALRLAGMQYNAIGSSEYESQRLRHLFIAAAPMAEINAELLKSTVSQVYVKKGQASLLLKNGQIIERSQ